MRIKKFLSPTDSKTDYEINKFSLCRIFKGRNQLLVPSFLEYRDEFHQKYIIDYGHNLRE